MMPIMDSAPVGTQSMAVALLLTSLLLSMAVHPGVAGEPIGPLGASVQCTSATYPLYVQLCRHPELLRKDTAVVRAYEHLSGGFTGEKRVLLATGQRYWFVELFACGSTPTSSRYHDGVYGCAEDKLSGRLHVLRSIANAPDTFMSTVANYTWIEPWYLDLFAQRYVGKHVTVNGKVVMESCNSSDPRSLRGHIELNGSDVGIRFVNLPASQLRFLCKSPSSQWDGTVRLDGGRPYLIATDVLGVPVAKSR